MGSSEDSSQEKQTAFLFTLLYDEPGGNSKGINNIKGSLPPSLMYFLFVNIGVFCF